MLFALLCKLIRIEKKLKYGVAKNGDDVQKSTNVVS